MKDSREIILEGEKYITASEAAALCGYTRIYVGQLCREEKVKGKKFGTDWMVSEKSILDYKKSILRTQEKTEPQVILTKPEIFHTTDEWDKAILGEKEKEYFQFPKIRFPKFSLKQWSLGAASLSSVLIAVLIFYNAGAIKNSIADATENINVSVKELAGEIFVVADEIGNSIVSAKKFAAGFFETLTSPPPPPLLRKERGLGGEVNIKAVLGNVFQSIKDRASLALSLPEIKLPKLTLPKPKLPQLTFKLPTFQLPNFQPLTELFAWPEIKLPSLALALPEFSLPPTLWSGLRLPDVGATFSLPFTFKDAKLSLSDIKDRFINNVLGWRGYIASLGGDLKLVAMDFFSVKPPEAAETPPAPNLPQDGSKIITFGESTSTPPSRPDALVGAPTSAKPSVGVVERVVSGLPAGKAGISQTELDQRLSSLNQAVLAQVQLSLAALEKRLPSNQVQNPVVFLTTSIPGPYASSPPQTGSGVSASFGDFSNGISTGGNLNASGNVTLGAEGKNVSITSNVWNVTSAGAVSGLASLTSTSLNSTSASIGALTVSGRSDFASAVYASSTLQLTGDMTLYGNLAFFNQATTTIASSLINAFSFATSTSVTPFLTFDTKNYRIGIGTTTPSATFSVSGDILASGGLNVSGASMNVNSTTTLTEQLLVTKSPTVSHTFGTWAVGVANSAVTDSVVVINPASAAADTNLLGIAVGGAVRFLVDADGDVFANGLTTVGGTTLASTTASNFTVENQFTMGDAPNADSHIFKGRITHLATTTGAAYTMWNSTVSGDLLRLQDGASEPTTRFVFSAAGQAAFGTTTHSGLSVLTIGATSTTAIPLTIKGVTSQSADLFRVLSSSDSSLFNVTSTGNVGIASTSPWGLLSVNPNALGAGVPSFVVGSSTATNFIVTNGGNVGIGTTGPLYKLDVVGGNRAATQITLLSMSYSDLQMLANDEISIDFKQRSDVLPMGRISGFIQSATNNDAGLKFYTAPLGALATTPAITINAAGNVGIGTTSPGALLSVQGSGYFSGTGFFGGAITATSTLNVTGLLTFGNASGTQLTTTGSTYLATSGGNVGIGTTNPTLPLDIQSETGRMKITSTTGTNYAYIDIINTGGTFELGKNWSTTGGLLTGASAYASVLQSTGTYPIQFAINDAIVMTLLSGGNVGIGTTSPGALLSVAGGGLFNSSITSYGTLNIPIFNATSTTATSTISGGLTVGNNTAFVVNRGATANSLYVAENGNVGIGTMSPANALHIFNSANTDKLILDGAEGSSNIRFNENGVDRAYIQWDETNNVLNFYTDPIGGGSSAIRMSIAEGGNVGIGTTSPWGLLSVEQGTETNSFVISNTGSSTPSFVVGGVNQNGRIGIGDASPSSLLELAGASADTVQTISAYSATLTHSGTLSFRKSVGTSVDTLSQTASGDELGVIRALGVNANNLFFSEGDGYAQIRFVQSGASASDSGPVRIDLKGTGSNGVTAPSLSVGYQGIAVGTYADGGATPPTNGAIISGNVGIGTTTPNWLLQAAGTRPSFALSDTSAGANLKHWLLSSMGGNLYVGTSTDAYATSTPPVLTLLNGGNVGIGLANPTTKVEIGGAASKIYFSNGAAGNGIAMNAGGSTRVGIENFSTGSNSRISLGYASTALVNITEVLSVIDNGNVGIGTTSPGSLLSVHGAGLFSSNLSVAGLTATGTLAVSGTATSTFGTGGFTIGTSQFVVQQTSGNVGIGTTSPDQSLVVRNNDALTGSAGIKIQQAGTGDATLRWQLPDVISWYAGIDNSDSDSFKISEDADFTGNEFVITTGGNVGIGTTSPASLFSVAGNGYFTGNVGIGVANPGTYSLNIDAGTTDPAQIRLSNTVTGAGASVSLYFDTGDGPDWFIGRNVSNSSSDTNFGIREGGVADHLVVAATTGNVGIGTTSPASLLSVQGNAYLDSNLITYSSSTAAALTFSYQKSATSTIPQVINAWSIATSSTVGPPIISVDGVTKRVGIGRVPTSESALEIQLGLGTSPRPLGVNIVRPSGSVSHQLGMDSNQQASFSMTNEAGDTVIKIVSDPVLSTDKSYINNGGDFGIASTTPWRTLSVAGTAAFSGLTAGAGAGALCLSANKEVTYSDGAACTGSSQRFKHDINSLGAGALETVLNLRPVSFLYNDDIGVKGEQVGLIAEEVFGIDPRLVTLDASSTPVNVKYANLTAVLAKAIQELNAKISGLALGTTGLLDLQNNDIINVRKILSASGLWSIDENGKLIVQEIETQKLTVTGPQGFTIYDRATGGPVCVFSENGVLKSEAGACGAAGSSTSGVSSSTPDVIPPVITILGNNPATINVGASYADMGVTVTDNVDSNLGYTASLNGGPALSQGDGLSLDTSTTTTHTILYSATDSAGNSATAVRTVEVVQ
ncbi:MAG: DUF5011 domain-containing protein [Candidatus Giovannonibacteria bacterium]|nr:MAG: DUF5011 domain-containing protein [Candidatus Giovannonibacteria bacterium]